MAQNPLFAGKTYRPIFAGKTSDDESIIVYVHIDHNTYHLQRDDGELWQLSEGAEVTEIFDSERNIMRIRIVSPEWKGTATGTQWDLMNIHAR